MDRSIRWLWLLMAAPFLEAGAAELIAEIPLTAGGDRANALAGTPVGDGVLRVDADPDNPGQLIVEIDDPGVSQPVFALTGELRHEGVGGTGFLQMDNDFGELGLFFTKSLAATGPLARIEGSGEWRPFVLPFFASSDDDDVREAPVPEKISLSVYLPAGGAVYLRDLALNQYAVGENPIAAGQWFGPGAAAAIGAIGGTLVGLWGALVGFLVSKGRARSFVLSSSLLLVGAGAVALVTGLAALGQSQPYAVYFPLLLGGVIILGVVLPLRKTFAMRYEAFEFGRMQAMDVTGTRER